MVETGDKVVVAGDKDNEWSEFVAGVLDMEDGDARSEAIMGLGKISHGLIILGRGGDHQEVIDQIGKDTPLVIVAKITQAIINFSPRGEEFRVAWNLWHKKPHSTMIFNPASTERAAVSG